MLGRATILLLISQGFFLISGYTVNVGLARLLGPVDFGTFGVVMSFLLVIQLFVITGIPIALQKFVAENMDACRLLMKKTLPWHCLYSTAIFILFWFAAPFVARLMRDDSLGPYLQIASFDIVFYGLYKYFISIQNGLHQFGRQTLTGIAYAISKPVAIFALVMLGYGVKGAIIGNTLGSLGGFLIAILILRLPEVRAELDNVPFFKFAFTNVFYFVGLQLLFSIDIWFVKYHLTEAAVGEYVSASSVAKIPYFLSLAVSSALLPSISRATKRNDEKRVQDIVRITMRYWLMLLLALVVVVSSNGNSLIVLFFGSEYAEGGTVLSVLFAAVACLTFAAVMNTILISRGRLGWCLRVIGLLILVHLAANIVFVPRFLGLGAALATLVAAGVAAVLSGCLVIRETKVLLPVLSAIRMLATGAFVFLIAQYIPLFHGLMSMLGRAAIMLCAFAVLLVLMRELSAADVRRLRAIIMRQ